MTRTVDEKKAVNYLRKADGALRMAKIAIKEGEYDNATMSAIHSAINALDALTVSFLGKRASGAHTDVLSFLKGIFTSTEYRDLQKQFTSLLNMKNTSEYQPDLMGRQDAEDAVKWAERILAKVKDKMRVSETR